MSIDSFDITTMCVQEDANANLLAGFGLSRKEPRAFNVTIVTASIDVSFWHGPREVRCLIRVERGLQVLMCQYAYGAARCSAEDKFDALTGKRLAFSRALRMTALTKDEKKAIKDEFRWQMKEARKQPVVAQRSTSQAPYPLSIQEVEQILAKFFN